MYKADIRIDESVLTENRKSQRDAGVKSRPIRKKGFRRALKRGDTWAIEAQNLRELTYELSKILFFGPTIAQSLEVRGLSQYIASSGSGITEDMLKP